MAVAEEQKEIGFEINGEFYPWTASDSAKDLMLIDEFTKMPASVFYEAIDDDLERGRGPIMLALMATSVRAKHPDWSVTRVARLIYDTPLSTVVYIGAPDEDGNGDARPPEQTENADKSPPSSESSSGSSEPPSSKRKKTQQ
jgi:hypothetical protein